jgi:LysM repeat protein
MKPTLKKTFSAILIALASLVIVIGITSLAMVQGGKRLLPGTEDTSTPTLVSTEPGTVITLTSVSETVITLTSVPENTAQTSTSSPFSCSTPKDWMPIIVMPNQTLKDIADQYKTSPEALQEGNCLKDLNIQENTIIFVPLTTPETGQGSAQCGAPAGWVYYYVQPGDTLYNIAAAYGISVNQLMFANCLKTVSIYVGQTLYVPNVPPYSVYPIQPIIVPTPWITIPDLLTPEVPYLPTGIPYPLPPP